MATRFEHLWRYTDTYQYLERVGKMPPVIICYSCNGGVQGKEANPNLPETADEIADSVHQLKSHSPRRCRRRSASGMAARIRALSRQVPNPATVQRPSTSHSPGSPPPPPASGP